MYCNKSGADHYVEEWDAMIHAVCAIPFLHYTEEGRLIMKHKHDLYLVFDPQQRKEQKKAYAERLAQQRVYSLRSSNSGYVAPNRGDAASCVRAHESDTSGGYSAVNPNGHYGAYQFKQSTWDNTVRAMGEDDLVGVRPDSASPADQDAAFEYLYGGGAGASHWAGSGC